MNLNPAEAALIGVDIGGSHITAAYVSPNQHNILDNTKLRLEVDAHADAKTIINTWVDTIFQLFKSGQSQAVKIGIAMPGPFDYETGISLIKGMNKYEALYGLNVRDLLASGLGIDRDCILFRNDAEAFLHGEVAVAGTEITVKTIGVTLGTGLGSAVNCDGVTKDVFRAITPMHDGIAEDYISTRWFLKRYNELTGLQVKNVKELLCVNDSGVVKALFSEFAQNLGRFLNEFAQYEDASIIVLGGNIAKCLDLFKSEMLSCIQKPGIVIKQTVLWEDAALVGAACSWNDMQLRSSTL